MARDHNRTTPLDDGMSGYTLDSRGGGGGVGAYLLNRAKPHLPPWIGIAGVGITGALGNWRWGESAAAGVGLTLGSVILTGATWWMGKGTSQQRRLHSAVTVAAGSAWLTAACLAGPTAGPIDDMYLIGGPVLALSWNVRMVLRRNDDPAGENGDKGLLAKVGLARAQIGAAKVEPNRVTAPLGLEAGEQTNDDVTKSLSRLASALDLPTSAVRYLPDPGSARRGELVIVPEDMLSEVVEWEGPSNLGGSIAEPLVLGRYDDGAPLLVWLPGDPEAKRNSTHILIAGGTGSGKGDTALNVQTEILSRRDVILWLSDPKSFQDFRPCCPASTGPLRAAPPPRSWWKPSKPRSPPARGGWVPTATGSGPRNAWTCRTAGSTRAARTAQRAAARGCPSWSPGWRRRPTPCAPSGTTCSPASHRKPAPPVSRLSCRFSGRRTTRCRPAPVPPSRP